MAIQLVKLLNGAVVINLDSGINYKGTFDSYTDYILGDLVEYLGSSYVAIQNTSGNLPMDIDFWQIVATKGDRGDTGTQGLRGIQGEKGDKGDKGDIGDTGVQGVQGIQGEKGNTGDTGAQGEQGIQGEHGDAGASFVITGTVATSDDLPEAGSAGEGYITSSTGNLWVWSVVTSSWHDVGRIVGQQGIQGIQGVQGEKGDKGDTGVQGVQGIQGIQGNAGVNGAAWHNGTGAPSNAIGVDGDYYINTVNDDVYIKTSGSYGLLCNIKGSQGATGATGATGNTGATGAKGDKGDTGATGASANTVMVKVIADSTPLVVGNGQSTFVVPLSMNGWHFTGVGAHVFANSTVGLPTIVVNKNGANIFSTNLTIDANEADSSTAATSAVIKSDGTQVVATGDVISVDVTVAGTGTKGLEIRFTLGA